MSKPSKPTPKDLRAMNRGVPIRSYPPDGGPARIKMSPAKIPRGRRK